MDRSDSRNGIAMTKKQIQEQTIEDRIRTTLVALEVVDGNWAMKLGEFAEAALAMRDRYGDDDRKFGTAWDAADFRYHNRRIGKTARAGGCSKSAVV